VNLSDIPSDVQALLRRHDLLQDLVVRCVRSELVESVVLTEHEINSARETLSQQFRLESPDLLPTHLQSYGLDLDEAVWQWTLPQRIRRYSHNHFGAKAEARFLDRKADLDVVVYSLLRVQDLGLANELFLRISGGEANFSDLAAQFSQGHEKTTRGIVGPVPMVKAHPRLRELLRTAAPAEVKPPIQIEDWYLVVRLESLIPAVLDDAMRLQMEQELFDADVQHRASAVLTTLVNPGSTPLPDA